MSKFRDLGKKDHGLVARVEHKKKSQAAASGIYTP